jgi:hypothetical protein
MALPFCETLTVASLPEEVLTTTLPERSLPEFCFTVTVNEADFTSTLHQSGLLLTLHPSLLLTLTVAEPPVASKASNDGLTVSVAEAGAWVTVMATDVPLPLTVIVAVRRVVVVLALVVLTLTVLLPLPLVSLIESQSLLVAVTVHDAFEVMVNEASSPACEARAIVLLSTLREGLVPYCVTATSKVLPLLAPRKETVAVRLLVAELAETDTLTARLSWPLVGETVHQDWVVETVQESLPVTLTVWLPAEASNCNELTETPNS